jgi:uncharacterized protein (TIGR02001 family)
LPNYIGKFESIASPVAVVATGLKAVFQQVNETWTWGHKMKLKHYASMAFSTLAVAVGTATGALAQTAAPAPAASDLKINFNVGVTSDYVFRGISQNDRNPAVQGGVDLVYGIAYAGIWASSVKLGDNTYEYPFKASGEVDLYAGIKPVWKSSLGDFNFDLGAIYYAYPGAADSIRIPGGKPIAAGLYGLPKTDYYEFKAGVNKDLWKDANLGTTIFFAPNSQFETGKVWTSETTFTQGFAAWGKVVPSFGATLGYQKGESNVYKSVIANGASGYVYGNAGVTLTYDEKISLDFRYWGTNIKDNNASGGFSDSFCTGSYLQCSSRALATLKFTY